MRSMTFYEILGAEPHVSLSTIFLSPYFEKIIDEDIDFTFTIGEDSGIYINGDMVKVDNDFLDLINKLQQYYQKFKSKWSRILASRKKTRETND